MDQKILIFTSLIYYEPEHDKRLIRLYFIISWLKKTSKKLGSLIPTLYPPDSTEIIHPNSLDNPKKIIKKGKKNPILSKELTP
jgi:hypothetical protein